MKKLMTFKTEAVFNPWLILAMLILLSVTFMVMPGAQAAGENNLILNPDFETGAKTPWNFYSNVAGNTFTVTSPGAASSANSAKVSLSSAGSNIQLNQKDITIEPNKSYTLTFDAYSNTGHDLKVSLFKNVSPYTNYGLNQTVNLTTSWQNFSFEFTSPALGGTVNDARLMFWFVTYGVAGDVYRIDNVVLKAADEPPPPPPPPPEDNLILNPGFESGTNNWAFYSGGAANFTVTSPGAAGSANSAKVSLSSAGSNIQLNQKDITIESNTSYTLTFDAYSNTGHDLKVSLFKNVAPYTNYGLNQTVNLTTSWKTYSYEFTSPALGGTVNDARLMLWFAAHGAAGDIYRIDNVALKDADALPPPPPPPPPEDNLILNPGYESGTNNWAFFSGGAAQFTVTSPGAAGSANSAKVSLSSAGSNIQLNQKDITIESNTRYRLTFDAYSNTGHDLKVSLFKNVAPYTNYGLNQTVNLTSSWQNFSFEFTSPNLGGTVNDARLMLWVAAHGAAGDIYRIDNVVLIETDAINHAPVLVPIGNKSIDEGGNLVFGVSASDPDGDFVIITASGLETWMSLNGGTFYATPGFSDSGSYSVTFTATDGELTDTETVTIIVNNIPQPPPPPPPEDNLILNPSYESGTNNWAFFSGGAAQFTVTSPGAAGSANSAKVSLSSAGSNIQLNQKDIAIASNTSYTLTFDAYSNTGHDLKVSLFKNVAPYTNYGLNQTVNLTSSWQNYSFEFTSPDLGGTVNDARLMFWFAAYGTAGDIYRIDNVVLTSESGTTPPGDPDRGIYAIWYRDLDERGEQILDLPFVTGGQIYRQWRWMEPSEGVYRFSQMDTELQELHEKGMNTTLQVNGEYKPDWLFQKVPYHDEKMGQVLDSTGSLMYWHPAHLKAYQNFLAAFAEYIKTSPYKSTILGVRMNINALGTEHTAVPSEYISLDQWNVPTGVEPGVEWTASIVRAYISEVVDTFISEFSGHTAVFVRNSIDSSIRTSYLDEFENGTLSWFHTSSEAEPRNAWTEGKYETFLDYARTGKTTAYAESYADAWGIHGTILDDRWCSPPKWNYWRLLIDLHCGVSFIAAYGVDLGVALDGTYYSPTYTEEYISYDDGASGTYQSEFMESFKFAAKYAGYHASPKQSPGAWIAFRENDVVIAENGISEAARTLQTITSDYTFLMERLPDSTLGQDIINIGPDDQRYGAWARQLPSYETINLNLNELFVESIDAQNVKLKIIYFYNRPVADTFVIKASGNEFSIPVSSTGKWETAQFTITNANFNKDLGSHIVIESGNNPIYFHMVEVTR